MHRRRGLEQPRLQAQVDVPTWIIYVVAGDRAAVGAVEVVAHDPAVVDLVWALVADHDIRAGTCAARPCSRG